MNKLFLGFLVLFLSVPAMAQAGKFTREQISLLNGAQDYLARIKTIRANFIQINPESTIVSSGELLIAKPGRLKMAYATPFKIDYYIINDDLLQYDHDLDEITRGAAPENPMKILLYNDVTLSQNPLMDITNITDDGKTFSIFMLNRTTELREVTGLILKFYKNPIEILAIERIDNEGNKTSTNLTSVKINQEISPEDIAFRKPKAAYPSQK